MRSRRQKVSQAMAAAHIQPGEAAAMTPEEHSRAVMAYVAGLLADFDRYLAAIVQPLLANAPGKGRRRRMLCSIFLPEPDSRNAARIHEH